MSKILLIITAIALVGCGKGNQPAPKKEVKESESTGLIADPIIEKAIREELGKPQGKHTKADLKKVLVRVVYITSQLAKKKRPVGLWNYTGQLQLILQTPILRI